MGEEITTSRDPGQQPCGSRDKLAAPATAELARITLQARAIGLSQELRDNLLKAVDATESWRREGAEIRCSEVFKSLSSIMEQLSVEGEK